MYSQTSRLQNNLQGMIFLQTALLLKINLFKPRLDINVISYIYDFSYYYISFSALNFQSWPESIIAATLTVKKCLRLFVLGRDFYACGNVVEYK